MGLGANWRQFTLLVGINGFVGAMVGLERTVVPLVASVDFGLASKSAILSFLVTFGLTKALANLSAGNLSDRLGRKPVLVAGWLVGLPVPFLLIFAPAWSWIVLANALLGINQGLCWSSTVVMKIDLVGPRRRGLAMGLNESAGYVAVSLSALLAGYLAGTYELRAAFYPGIAFALFGLLGSTTLVRETHAHARGEARVSGPHDGPAPRFGRVFWRTTWSDRTLRSLSQAGLANNLNDAMVWGLLPIVLAGARLSLTQTGTIAATYPGVWGIGQIAAGAVSDRWGRKALIVAGMWIQAAAIAVFAAGHSFLAWMIAATLLGIGTACVYPTVLAAVSDRAHPAWRATALGVYRLWRDSGYVVGALLTGAIADFAGVGSAMWAVACVTFASGVIVLTGMQSAVRERHLGGVR